MKITSVTSTQNQIYYKYNKTGAKFCDNSDDAKQFVSSGYSMRAYCPNISFHGNPDKQLFMQLSEYIGVCAYSGRLLLRPKKATEIYSDLEKRFSAQDAINYLMQYKIYMRDKEGRNYVEGNILDLLQSATHKNKKNFQDILLENRQKALENLKKDERQILISTDPLIECIIDNEVQKNVKDLRNEAFYFVESDHFSRKIVLEKLLNIKSDEDKNIIKQIYRMWYKLPRSSDNVNAFIIKYAEKPHDKIGNRLLSASEMSIEHVIASSNGGPDELGNYVPLAKIINNLRSSMPIMEFNKLNPKIKLISHLYEYVEKVKAETNRTKSPWHSVPWYLNDLQKNIAATTDNRIIIDTSGIQCSQKDINFSEHVVKKLGTRFSVK